MKKFIVFFLLILCISFNFMVTANARTLFKEGVYQLSELEPLKNKSYTATNLSKTDEMFMQIYDDNQVLVQYLRMPPNKQPYNLVELKPNYRIIVLGTGEVSIS